jgi:hypothetical protein
VNVVLTAARDLAMVVARVQIPSFARGLLASPSRYVKARWIASILTAGAQECDRFITVANLLSGIPLASSQHSRVKALYPNWQRMLA